MSVERSEALVRELPTPWRKAAEEAPAVTVTFAAPTDVVVDDWTLTCSRNGAVLFSTSLRPPLTIGQLVADLPMHAGVSNAVAVEPTVVLAACLVDQQASGTTVSLLRYTNPTWRLLDTLAGALVSAVQRADIGLAQANLLHAGGDFADWWARWTGAARHVAEGDGAFTGRQLHELIRHRDNNLALATLIQDDFGVPVVEVRNLLPLAFQCSDQPMRGRPLRGWRYNATCAEVVLGGFPSLDLIAATRANAAAGVTVFVRGTLSLAGADATKLGGPDILVGSPPAMQIGVRAIGVGKVGP